MEGDHGPLERILRDVPDDLVRILGDEVPGADLTSLLLAVMRYRAAGRSPAEVLGQYEQDRFATPSGVPLLDMRRAEDALLSTLPPQYDQVLLSPVVPLGTHSVVAPVDQNNVVTTVRSTEVAADPTSGLALEAAVRRRELLRGDPRSSARVDLATVQRVLRAQQFEGPVSFSHFTILGLVSAGRDTGRLEFEKATATSHAVIMARGLAAAGADEVVVSLSDFGGGGSVVDAVSHALDGMPGVVALADPDRRHARGYYRTYAHRVDVRFGSTTFEVGDGGFVDWTQQYVASAKERCLISGIGVDRVAIAANG